VPPTSSLLAERGELTLGRNPIADLSIGWDDQVSAPDAVIERLAGELTPRDDGLLRNGSYVNGERVHGMRRLRDGDMLRLGRTVVLVRNPADAGRSATAAAPQPLRPVKLSEQQRTCRKTRNASPSPNGLSKAGCSATKHRPCARGGTARRWFVAEQACRVVDVAGARVRRSGAGDASSRDFQGANRSRRNRPQPRSLAHVTPPRTLVLALTQSARE